MNTKDPYSMNDIDPMPIEPNTTLLDSGQESSEPESSKTEDARKHLGKLTDSISQGLVESIESSDYLRDHWVRCLQRLVELDTALKMVDRVELDKKLSQIKPPP